MKYIITEDQHKRFMTTEMSKFLNNWFKEERNVCKIDIHPLSENDFDYKYGGLKYNVTIYMNSLYISTSGNYGPGETRKRVGEILRTWFGMRPNEYTFSIIGRNC